MKQALIIFSKNEVYGKVKTRLAATTSHELALAMYRTLLKHTHEITSLLNVQKIVFYSDYIDHQDLWDTHNYQKRLQIGYDLGQRMTNAFADIFDEGAELSVIIGTDCPELSSALIIESFDRLKLHDVVIGPAKDGGYYLLGMKKLKLDLFQEIDWSTDRVLSQTLNVCEEKNLSVFLLRELMDIDTEEDLRNMQLTL